MTTQLKVHPKVNLYTLTLKDITQGQLIAITRALRYYNSPVSNDVLDGIRIAIGNSGYPQTDTVIEASIDELTKNMMKNQKSS